MIARVAATALAVALLASACGADEASDPPPLVTSPPSVGDDATGADASGGTTTGSTSSTAPLPAVSIAQIDCPDDLLRPDGLALACGLVTVPIDRADGADGSTRITVATLAGYDTGFETPLAVLQGGPGGASSDFGAWFPQQPFTQVFIDQRGVGFAGPDFDCPEIIDAMPRILASSYADAAILSDEAYDDCARRLDQDLVLQHTESETHAGDVADTMAALGYDRWVVYGVSYGSTIGLELLRDEPDGVAGVILDGVYPPQLDTDAALVASASRALDVLDEACGAEAVCRQYLADGSVRTTLERVMAELDERPMSVLLGGNRVGLAQDVELLLDGRRAAELIFPLMYQEAWLRYIPAIVGGLDDRDESSARWLAETGVRVLLSSSSANDEGTYFAVQCHDRLPFTDGPGDVDDPFAAAVAAAPLAKLCGEWERDAAPPLANEPVTSDIATLLLSGTFDPITPPSHAASTAETLTNATVVVQDGRGHGIWVGDSCIAQIVQQFVADPARTLDTSCADSGVDVEWARP
ncbi:MAG: alpha/beta hydrolase [Acidimicrobiales bacterium]|nr:MAG: alpha/beta hydrolase [Acidimicrobiales bacterium]